MRICRLKSELSLWVNIKVVFCKNFDFVRKEDENRWTGEVAVQFECGDGKSEEDFDRVSCEECEVFEE